MDKRSDSKTRAGRGIADYEAKRLIVLHTGYFDTWLWKLGLWCITRVIAFQGVKYYVEG